MVAIKCSVLTDNMQAAAGVSKVKEGLNF